MLSSSLLLANLDTACVLCMSFSECGGGDPWWSSCAMADFGRCASCIGGILCPSFAVDVVSSFGAIWHRMPFCTFFVDESTLEVGLLGVRARLA